MLHLLECSPIAQFAVGLDHKITVWNKACELLTGFTAEEMINTDRQWEPFYPHKRPIVADLIIDNDFEQFLKLYKDKNGQLSSIVPNAWEASCYFPSLGGASRFIYFLAAPIINAEGKVIGAVETLQDFTRQKELESYLKNESAQLRQENITLKSSISERYRFGNIVGKSKAMQDVYELIIQAVATDSNVVIYGESGTGKELVGRTIHEMSDRMDKNFVIAHCGAIPEQNLEYEFFGNGGTDLANQSNDQHGYLQAAAGGTLFLDEVGNLIPSIQVKILRAIESGDHLQNGNPDIRIIAATDQDLEEKLAKGHMREDFFYRLQIIPIKLPTLRKRKEDLPLLIDYFLKMYGSDKKISSIPGKVYDILLNYDWPGNVRELQNVLRRYLAINKIDLGRKLPTYGSRKKSAVTLPPLDEADGDLRQTVESCEKNIILNALNNSRWHRGKTAMALGISRKTLFRKMKQLGIA